MPQKNRWLTLLRTPDIQFALVMICIIFMLVIPLSPVVLDILLSLSITTSFLILLLAIYVKDALDFSTFPTFLLLTTLFRLALNVATTRNILLDGASGDVSNVISSFGDFVVGGNYFVGFVIFLILVIINFMVITKGAGRVAEVGARFTLDAMPGKQMSIDADLNAGLIDRDEARRRRAKIEDEADFYGSMDGASKFVRGDAIAGIIITGINILVGLAVGVMQHDMDFSRATEVFALLTVGDGLVSQIPAIIISVAAGIIVTRAGGDDGLANQLSEQILLHPKAHFVCSALLSLLSLLPGLPSLALLLLAVLFLFSGMYARQENSRREKAKKQVIDDEEKAQKSGDRVESLLHLDTLALEVGVNLIPLVDQDQNGEILERIISARKQFAQDMGIIVPMVMVRDNIQLKPGDYQILLKGQVIAKGSLLVDHLLAMAPEEAIEEINGIPTKEPAYGLDATWIKESQKEEVSFKGYTVVNGATVVVTHLSKVIQEHSHELIGRQEVQNLVDNLKERAPKVVEEVLSNEGIQLGTVVRVIQNLLKEQVSIRDFLTLFESLADHCRELKHPDTLTRYARKYLGRSLTSRYLDQDESLRVISLERGLEDLLISSLQQHEGGQTSMQLEPQFAQNLLNKIVSTVNSLDFGNIPVLICGAQLRWDLKKLIERFLPGLVVLAFDEIPSDTEIKTLGLVNIE